MARFFFTAPDVVVTIPAGVYGNDRSVNLGENLWAFRLGLTAAKVLTSKGIFARAKISAEFYTKNNEYTTSTGIGCCELGQDPMFELQAFLTQFLNPKTYISLNYFYDYGGETEVDGVMQNDRTKTYAMQLGASDNIRRSGFSHHVQEGTEHGKRLQVRYFRDQVYLHVPAEIQEELTSYCTL